MEMTNTSLSWTRPTRWAAILAVLLVLLLVLVASQHVPSHQAQDLLRRGDALRDDYLYLSAASNYRQAAQLTQDPTPWLRLGDIYIRLKQYPDAAQAYAQASQHGGNTPQVHAGLARALEGNDDLIGAVYHWRQVEAHQPENTQAQLELARLLVALGQWSEAQAALTALLERQPNHPLAHLSLGQLLALDNPTAARAHLQAAASDPTLAQEVADWLAVLNDSEDASYRAARVGRLLLAKNKLPLARRALERAVELNPDYAEAQTYLGYVLDLQGDNGGSLLEQAAQATPDSVIALYFLGLHQRAAGDLDSALSSFESALARDPQNAALVVEIGLTAMQAQAYVDGESWLNQAVELEPNNPAWVKQLAHHYLGRFISVKEKGLPSAQEAVRLAPDDAEARDLLGWALHLTGNDAAAQAELQRALELDPLSASAHYHMAAVLTALGRANEAQQETERAASLDPSGELGKRAREILEGKK